MHSILFSLVWGSLIQGAVSELRRRVACCIAVILLAANCLQGAPGTVYLVIGSDTAIWDGLDLTRYHCHFRPDLYSSPGQNAYTVMNMEWRNRLVDSYGQTLKLTWWSLVGGLNLPADNQDAPIGNLMPLYLLRKYHGDAMRGFGDELSLHYHTFFWSDYNHDGRFFWNEARTFHECREDFDLAVAQSFLEEEVFPVSFRSGWHFMDNEWQSYLDTILPFSLHRASPILSTSVKEPLANNYDWSKAPTTWVPVHPSPTNYQLAGDSPGWNVRSVKMPSMTQKAMNAMFAQAAEGTDQVACLWAHLPEVDFPTNIIKMDIFAHAAATNYPDVRFRYCTAIEAMQRWLKTSDQTPPQLEVTQQLDGDTLTLGLRTDEAIFQPSPVVAIKDVCSRFQLLSATPVGSNAWRLVVPVPRSRLAKLGVAVTDLVGNLTQQILRFVPDDLYVDNSDSGYSEVLGTWSDATSRGWGTNARVATLTGGQPARARWTLGVSNAGTYRISVQVPGGTNAARGVAYVLFVGGTSVATNRFSDPLPPNRWTDLGTFLLSGNGDNALEMSVDGEGQAEAQAAADVVRVSPLTASSEFFNDVVVDAGDTTATISWTTAAPSVSRVGYGVIMGYPRDSVTNLLSVTHHVVTLRDLSPNTIYYYGIDALAAGTVQSCPCGETGTPVKTFSTQLLTASYSLFSYTNSWKFTTNNLDGEAWTAPGYVDLSWAEGKGVLWVDTRSETSLPALPNKGTQMPEDVTTKYPYPTYYFRTHFDFIGAPRSVSLTFSNYLDDGAVFYLNDVEIHRENMAASPVVISNATLSVAYSCSGDATCPVSFLLAGDALAPLVTGDNVLAVEVHNFSRRSTDISFGLALRVIPLSGPDPVLHVVATDGMVTLYWNGEGLVLEEADGLLPLPLEWKAVAGSSSSPVVLAAADFLRPMRFYRLRTE